MEQSLIFASIGFVIWYSIQPNMIFQIWLDKWATIICKHYGKDVKGMDIEDKISLSLQDSKLIKPLGACVKCFAVWIQLLLWLPALIDAPEKIGYYFISISIMVWLAVQTS